MVLIWKLFEFDKTYFKLNQGTKLVTINWSRWAKYCDGRQLEKFCYMIPLLIVCIKIPTHILSKYCYFLGQVDSPEAPETPEITEIIENFINCVWEKSHFRNSQNETFRRFRVFGCVLWKKTKTRKCWKSTESFLNKKAHSVNDYHYRKTA